MVLYTDGGCPSERFAQIFPTMWGNVEVVVGESAVFRERMDAALQSMRETYKIIQSAHDNQTRTLRQRQSRVGPGDPRRPTLEDIHGPPPRDVDTTRVDDVLRELNRNGDRYQKVPF